MQKLYRTLLGQGGFYKRLKISLNPPLGKGDLKTYSQHFAV